MGVMDIFRFRKEIDKNWFTNRVMDHGDKLNRCKVLNRGYIHSGIGRKAGLITPSQEQPCVGRLASCSIDISLRRTGYIDITQKEVINGGKGFCPAVNY